MRKYDNIIRCVGDKYWLWDDYTQFWQEASELRVMMAGLPLEDVKSEAYTSVRFDLFTEQLVFED